MPRWPFGDGHVAVLESDRPVEAAEKSFPVFMESVGTDVLSRRYDVEDEKAFAAKVVLHDSVKILGVRGVSDSLFQRFDLSFIATFCVSPTATRRSCSNCRVG
jgi:hypothetical protein